MSNKNILNYLKDMARPHNKFKQTFNRNHNNDAEKTSLKKNVIQQIRDVEALERQKEINKAKRHLNINTEEKEEKVVETIVKKEPDEQPKDNAPSSSNGYDMEKFEMEYQAFIKSLMEKEEKKDNYESKRIKPRRNKKA